MSLHIHLFAAALAWFPGVNHDYAHQLIDEIEAAAPDVTPDEALMLLSLAFWETHLLPELHDGCPKPWSCDGGLAHGPYQLHTALPWVPEATQALRLLRAAPGAWTTYGRAHAAALSYTRAHHYEPDVPHSLPWLPTSLTATGPTRAGVARL